MTSRQSDNLVERVHQAAAACLERDGCLGPLELLQEMRFLHPVHVEAWQKGNPYYTPLEPHIQCGAEKLQKTYRYFEEWVRQHSLVPIEAPYVRSSPRGPEPLQVTADTDPERERYFRTRYAPADLPEKKSQKLREKLARPADLVVFELVSPDSRCEECQAELHKGELLFLERGRPLCLTCADLDQLEFLPRGDTALTRRARKHSPLAAVVVRFSRARKRYERQGILVTPEALARAEAECTADAAERAERRRRDASRRLGEDREFVEALTGTIRTRYPGCPADEAGRIAEHTALRGSGRVGRSAAGRALEPRTVDLAVVAWVRHQHTDYDALLMQGTERLVARERIRAQIERVLSGWSAT
jgi:hypothetical protein